MTPGERVALLAACLLIAALAIGRFCALPEEEPPIDHELDAGRAAQVRAWTGGEAEKPTPTRVCCPCPCGALAFCAGSDR